MSSDKSRFLRHLLVNYICLKSLGATISQEPIASRAAAEDEATGLPSEPEDDVPLAAEHSASDGEAAQQLPDSIAGPPEATEPQEADEGDLDSEPDPRHDDSNIGQYSPEPLSASQIYGQDVVSEQEDRRMLDLLRAQVCERRPPPLPPSSCTGPVRVKWLYTTIISRFFAPGGGGGQHLLSKPVHSLIA